ncbi:MAG: maleylpyruvate isomerase family mycothiol-dependent enzyme [Acidimicrobiales bacterium]
MDKADYLRALETESEQFLTAAAATPLDAPVEYCGDWSLGDLLVHQTEVWAFATANVLGGGELSQPAAARPADEGKLLEWAAGVRTTMLEALQQAESHAVAWSFVANNQTAGFWHRRMVAETAVHRWDAQRAGGEASPIDPEVASDGIDEYTQVGLRFSGARPNRIYPAQSLHLHCTDTTGEWTIVGTDGPEFTVTREHTKADAAVRGEASALLLWIWGRDGGAVEVLGDAAVAATWRALAP